MNASNGAKVLVGAGTIVVTDNTDDTADAGAYVAKGTTAQFAANEA
jgi:hypothetical protein